MLLPCSSDLVMLPCTSCCTCSAYQIAHVAALAHLCCIIFAHLATSPHILLACFTMCRQLMRLWGSRLPRKAQLGDVESWDAILVSRLTLLQRLSSVPQVASQALLSLHDTYLAMSGADDSACRRACVCNGGGRWEGIMCIVLKYRC
jgi:hypothetical protein